jgi:iron complex transport system ATP-binding protein
MKTTVNTDQSIILDNLLVGYHKSGNKIAVYGPVNAYIGENEMIGIIGRNGIGKSTLLRTLAGLQPPLDGEVKFNGITVNKIGLKQLAKTVSYVSTEQVHGFQIRVNELITLGRFPYSGWLGRLGPDDRQAIAEAVHLTGIEHLLTKSVNELSDGERQKVMIARALAQDTPFIILDEPTAFLDLPARYEILRILNNLTRNNNKTILFSTHDLSIAIDVADKLWLMTGSEMYVGSPEDLLIKKLFRKLFMNTPAEFDITTMQFHFLREYKRNIIIRGEGRLKALTGKSMERIGFKPHEESDLIIELGEINEKHSWHLTGPNDDHIFFSIYDLAVYLKKHF